jgi:hypothetical protein
LIIGSIVGWTDGPVLAVVAVLTTSTEAEALRAIGDVPDKQWGKIRAYLDQPPTP